MPKTFIRPLYQNLLNEIGSIYTDSKLQARSELNKILTKAYWQIGKRIVQVEQDHENRAQYGGRLIERLSHDLSEKHGDGFSAANLYRMRKFFVTHPNLSPVINLDWSKQCILLGVKDDHKRLKYEDLAISQSWSRAKLIETLKNENLITAPSKREQHSEVVPGGEATSNKKLSAKQGPLYVYLGAPGENGTVNVDVGFSITRTIKSWAVMEAGQAVRSLKSEQGYDLSKVRVTPKDLYTYRATLERVIDGDTLKLNIDLGFDTSIRETVRLRGINTPEIKSEEGQRAKQFVQRFLKEKDTLIIKTHREDKFGRYLVDVWVNHVYLNQELLDRRLASLY